MPWNLASLLETSFNFCSSILAPVVLRRPWWADLAIYLTSSGDVPDLNSYAHLSSAPMPPYTRSMVPSRLLSLPAELRLHIYGFALDVAATAQVDDEDCVKYTLHAALFRVNKQVSREAWTVWSRVNTFVRVETPWEQAAYHFSQQGKVGLLAKGRAADKFRGESLFMRSGVSEIYLIDGERQCRMIILAQDIPKLTQLWEYSNLTHLGLNEYLAMDLTLLPKLRQRAWAGQPELRDDEVPLRLQEQLLLPFHKIKGLSGFHVHNAHADVEARLLREMRVPAPTAEQCLEQGARLKELGNAAVKAAQYRAALEHYYDALKAMHIVVFGKNKLERKVWAEAFFDRELHDGPFARQYGAVVRITLRIELVSNILLAFLKLDEFRMVEHWGMRSIKIMRDNMGPRADLPRTDFPAAAAWGKIYYRTGMALKGLGEHEEAGKLLRIAADWLPNDAEVQKQKLAAGPRPL